MDLKTNVDIDKPGMLNELKENEFLVSNKEEKLLENTKFNPSA